MIRRTIGFFITVAITGWAFYQIAWNEDIVSDLGGSGFFVILIAFGLVAALLFWKASRLTMVMAVILGAIGATVLDDVIADISWSGVWKAALALIVLGLLWVLTCADEHWFNGARHWVLRRLPAPRAEDDQAPGPTNLRQTGTGN